MNTEKMIAELSLQMKQTQEGLLTMSRMLEVILQSKVDVMPSALKVKAPKDTHATAMFYCEKHQKNHYIDSKIGIRCSETQAIYPKTKTPEVMKNINKNAYTEPQFNTVKPKKYSAREEYIIANKEKFTNLYNKMFQNQQIATKSVEKVSKNIKTDVAKQPKSKKATKYPYICKCGQTIKNSYSARTHYAYFGKNKTKCFIEKAKALEGKPSLFDLTRLG